MKARVWTPGGIVMLFILVVTAGWLRSQQLKGANNDDARPSARPEAFTNAVTGDLAVQLLVMPRDQEGYSTCWATCAEMIMEFIGPLRDENRIRQCQQATNDVNQLPADCCDRGNLKAACDNQGYPDFPAWGFSQSTNFTTTPLTWDQAVREIDAGRPFTYSFHTFSGSLHMHVVNGYQVVNGEKSLLCLNPWPSTPTSAPFVLFQDYESSHDRDYFEIKH